MRKLHRKRRSLLLGAALALTVFLSAGLYDGLKLQHYTVEAAGVAEPVRIVLITDLHSCRYGENEWELVEVVAAQEPDLLLFAGDIFDDALPHDNTAALLRAVAGEYPCCYVTGNHEYWGGRARFEEEMAILADCGIRRLSGEVETVTVRGTAIDICGVDDPDARLLGAAEPFAQEVARVRALAQEGHYTVLLSHRPESFALYAAEGFDLALCGHAHGGQWRIPGLLNGLYAPGQGLFPKYAGGLYRSEGTAMIVSRGLARESTRVPRFWDRPELVVVDLI